MSTLFGMHEGWSYDETLARFPKTTEVREFVPGIKYPGYDLVRKINILAQPALDKGLTPWISFKTLPDDVLSGAWDAELDRVAREVDSRVKLIPYHEPEDNLAADDFVDMFEHVAEAIVSAGGMQDLVYSAMAYQWRPGSDTTPDPQAWLPPNADIYAADVYSGRSEPLTAILPEHEGFVRWYDAVRDTGIPWAITERGFITGDDDALRVASIQDETEWLVESDCYAYLYWNTSGTESDVDIVLDDTGEEAVRELSEAITAPEPEPETPEGDCTAAYSNGYNDGDAAGYTRGYSAGYDLGKHDGTIVGKQAAWNLLQDFLDDQGA